MNKQSIFLHVLTILMVLTFGVTHLCAQRIENGKLISWVGAAGDIKIPDGVSEVAAQCFYVPASSIDPDDPWGGEAESNTQITSIDFNQVKIVGKEAFRGCTGIVSIVASSLTMISESAFEGCSALKAISLPQIVRIDNSAFAHCAALASVHLGKTVATIGVNPFVNNEALSSITIEAGGSAFVSESNAIVRKADGMLICLAGQAQDIAIGETCQGIGESAMKDCKLLTKIDLPYAKVIGNKSLSGCSRLSELLVPRLESVDNSSYITFNGVGSLQVVDVHLNPAFLSFAEAIADRAEMKVYVASEEVKTRLKAEFKQAQIIVGSPTALQEVRVDFSHNEGGAMEVWMSGAIDIVSGQKVPAGTTVSFQATPRFDYEIESWTLNGKPITSGIENNKIYRIENIHEDANLIVSFRKLPDGYYIFFKSKSPEFGTLTCRIEGGNEIKYGDKVARDARLIFTATPRKGYRVTDWYKDQGVGTNIDFVKIDGLTGQTTYTCAAEDGLDLRADFDRNEGHYIVRYRSLNVSNGTITATMADGTTIEPSEALPAGSKVIFAAHPSTGMAVEGWYNYDEEITGQTGSTYTIENLSADLDIALLCGQATVPTTGEPIIKNGHLISWKPVGAAILPAEVTHIDGKAFEGANEMTALSLNSAVKYIGELPFLYAAELKSIDVPSDNEYYSSLDGILYNKDRSILIAYPGGRLDKSFAIPSSVGGIQPGAFVSTPHLLGISVTAGNQSLVAQDGALYTKGLNTLLYFPNGFNPEPQKEIRLPEGLQQIGRLAMAYIPVLSKLQLPASLTTIAPLGLAYNPALETLELSSNDAALSTIADSAFYYSRSLKELPYVASLRAIGFSAFSLASSLEAVHIPAGSSIGDRAFYNCEAIKAIYAYDALPATITAETFFGIAFPDECQLFVPKGSRAAYAEAIGWKIFAKQISEVEGMSIANVRAQTIQIYKEGTNTVVEGLPVGTAYSLYDSSGRKILQGFSGERIILSSSSLPNGFYVLRAQGMSPIKLMH